MTLKLALGNVKRCARDYGVYFITLALAVAMFYAFNSLQEQTVLIDGLDRAGNTSKAMFDMMGTFMQIFSIAVAFVLAFLVVYANRFLLKRRRREFGMYLTLGMGPGQVSRILLVEVAIVGLVSLAVGIALGIAASQGMAFATAALMGATMSQYRFIVSTSALVMTLICFAAIFVLSAIVDVVYISRRKLADLISTHELSEKTIMRNPVVSCVLFIASLVIIGLAYWQLSINGLVLINESFYAATALMLVGTTLFFWSVMGFVNVVAARSKSLRFKGLSSFTLRQLSSKVNTAFASMTVICVMLFFAATTLAVGFGMVKAFVGDIDKSTQYDATISEVSGMNVAWTPKKAKDGTLDYDTFIAKMKKADPEGYKAREHYHGDMAACLADRSADWERAVKSSAQMDFYLCETSRDELLESVGKTCEEYDIDNTGYFKYPTVVSVEQVNQVRALTGKKPFELAEDRFLILNSLGGTDKVAKALSDGGATLTVGGHKLTATRDFDDMELKTSATASTVMEIVVPQSAIDSLKASGAVPRDSILNVMYKTDRPTGDELLWSAICAACPFSDTEGLSVSTDNTNEHLFQSTVFPLSNVVTAQEMVDQAMGLRMIITYLALYIGFVLMLTTAAILAIQQLSETADSLPRYRTLSTLGADSSQVCASLRHQTIAYFAAPLVVAACHTACALQVITSTLMSELGVDMASPVGATVTVICVIYLVYFVIAYQASKAMVKSVLV